MLMPGRDGPTAIGRVLRRNDSTFAVSASGSVTLLASAAGLAAASPEFDNARVAMGSRLRDSLGLTRRGRREVGRSASAPDPLARILFSRAGAEALHGAYRTSSRSSESLGAGRVRYRGPAGVNTFEIEVDSASGAVLAQTSTAPDGSATTTRHTYAVLPGGTLARATSRSTYATRAGPSFDRTVTIAYSNIRVR